MKTSLIIPFRNEVGYAEATLSSAHQFLSERNLEFELIAVDDSSDGTWEIAQSFAARHENVVAVKGGEPPGYGKALRTGFRVASGDILIPFNGDLCDSLDDVAKYIELINEGYDMVFGSRYKRGATVQGSSIWKGGISRLGNCFLQVLFLTSCNDLTNSFKAYRRKVIDAITPTSEGYELGMEIALTAIIKGYHYTTIPVSWTERTSGQSKMVVLRVIPRFLRTAIRTRVSRADQ